MRIIWSIFGVFASFNHVILARLTEMQGRDTHLMEAVELLETVGIHGLCHPTSNEYAPLFPKCADGMSFDQRELLSEADSDDESISTGSFYIIQNALMAVLCVFVAAVAAGLTLGLLSIDPLNLLVKMRTAASEEERKEAASLLPIVRQHHLLLVTLLILNSMANEALPLFLDKVVPSYMAILLSVTLVLFFGEIIPSAIFTGPGRIKVAATLAPVVRLFMCLLYPVAFPISKALDVLLHDEDDSASFSRHELSAIVRIQYEERLSFKKEKRQKKERNSAQASAKLDESSTLLRNVGAYDPDSSMSAAQLQYTSDASDLIRWGGGSSERGSTTKQSLDRTESIHFDEVTMLEGALKMKTKLAIDIYTPLRRVFAVPYDMILTESKIVEIYSSGYSRVPVFRQRPEKLKDKSDIVGILLTKQLIVVDTHDKRPIRTLPLLIPFCVSPTMNLVDLINVFQSASTRSKGGHMALVCARPLLAEQALGRGESIPEQAGIMGIVTLEDCIEELLQEQIFDETDRQELYRAKVALRAWRKWRLFVKKGKTKSEEATIARMHHPLLLDVVEAAKAADAADASESTPIMDRHSRPKRFFALL